MVTIINVILVCTTVVLITIIVANSAVRYYELENKRWLEQEHTKQLELDAVERALCSGQVEMMPIKADTIERLKAIVKRMGRNK